MSSEYYATDFVAYFARLRPQANAITDVVSGEAITWADLEERVGGLAGALGDEFGVGPGDRVALLANNHPWSLVIELACWRLGAIYVPLNFRLVQSELEFLCSDSEPAVLIHDAAYREAAAKVTEGAGVPRLASFGLGDTSADDLGAASRRATPRKAGLLSRMTDTVQLIYTSGTTGRPKGAIVTHQTLHYQTLNSIEPYELSSSSKYLAVLPFFHAGGLNSMANPILSLGGTVSVAPGFDPAQAVALLGDAAAGFTHFSAAPVMYQAMSAVPAFADADFSHLRHGQVGGGFLNWDVTKAFHDRGWALSPGWGSTEMGPIASVVAPEAALTKLGSCGVPVQYTQLRIVGADGHDVAVGETGEAWVHGPSIIPGYWRRNRAEDPAFAGEWFRSGDAVTQDEDGYLTIVDRIKDMYKSGGENVYPAEIERVLQSHPEVADAAVIPIVHERWGEVGRALLVAKPGAVLDTESVREHCRTHLAKYKVPFEFLVVEPFERNGSGKLPKADLKKTYGSGVSTVAPALTPSQR
jgi:fatty-acyl-CoA synthase